MKISVIVPAFNIASELTDCLESLEHQTLSKCSYEVIIVDDCSLDDTFEIARQHSGGGMNVRCYRLGRNGGPGVARNKGIDEAKGDFVVFLDGDDFLPDYALESLNDITVKHRADVVTFNWAYSDGINNPGQRLPQRRDLFDIPDDKMELARLYLSMNFDGSVIYTMTSKKLLDDNVIRFPGGLHEDMSVIFKIYYCSKNLSCEERVMYLKRNREGSIVNSISREHIEGYFSSWPNIKNFIIGKMRSDLLENIMPYYMKGVTGLIACVLLKNMTINGSEPHVKNEIYLNIYEKIQYYFSAEIGTYSLPDETRYDKLANCFYKAFSENHGKSELAASNFESDAIRLNLTNSHCCYGAAFDE
mgnify:CR=1 FL=1